MTKVLYHYCSLSSLLAIIESKKIWLSSADNMNDKVECQWATHVLKEITEYNRYDEEVLDQDELSKKDLLLKKFRSYRHLPPLNTCYFFSLSNRSDSLSQWRSYANDGLGVSIGFKVSKNNIRSEFDRPTDCTEPNLYKVRYIDFATMEKKIWEAFRRVFENGNTRKSNVLFDQDIDLYNLQFKNRAFYEEEEFRVMITRENANVFPPLDDSIYNNLKFRESDSKLVAYYEYDFTDIFGSKKPIVEICLGPKSRVSETDLKLLLHRHKIAAQVKRSTATYH